MKKDIAEFVSKSRVPIGEGRTSETYRNSSAFTYTGMEVGTHHHGLRCRFSSYSDRPRCHLDDYG